MINVDRIYICLLILLIGGGIGQNANGQNLYSALTSVNVRIDPETGSRAFYKLKEGEAVIFEGKVSKEVDTITLRGVKYIEPWLRIKTSKGQRGWVYAGALKCYHPQKLQVPGGFPLYVFVDKLRMRAGPSTQTEIIAELPENAPLTFEGEVTEKRSRHSMRGVYYDEPWLKVTTQDGKTGWVYGGGVKTYTRSAPNEPVLLDPDKISVISAFDAYPWEEIKQKCRYQNLKTFHWKGKFSWSEWTGNEVSNAEKTRFLLPLDEYGEVMDATEYEGNTFPLVWYSWQGLADNHAWATVLYIHNNYHANIYLLKMSPEGETVDWWKLASEEVEIGYKESYYGHLSGDEYRAVRVKATTQNDAYGRHTTGDSLLIQYQLLPDHQLKTLKTETHTIDTYK